MEKSLQYPASNIKYLIFLSVELKDAEIFCSKKISGKNLHLIKELLARCAKRK